MSRKGRMRRPRGGYNNGGYVPRSRRLTVRITNEHGHYHHVSVPVTEPDGSLKPMITATVTELLAVQKSQLDYYGQQLSAPAAAELRRRIAARTTHYPRPDMTIEVAYAEIPRGGDIELERDRILSIINAVDPLVLMGMTDEAVALHLVDASVKQLVQRIKDGGVSPEATAAHLKMKRFMNELQWRAVRSYMSGEEGEFFQGKMIELAGVIDAMPRTKQGDPDNPVVHLHYFRGSADWHITELDMGAKDDTPEQFMSQCFGHADLFGDHNGEWGYISIPEIVKHRAELDFHWTPRPLLTPIQTGKPYV